MIGVINKGTFSPPLRRRWRWIYRAAILVSLDKGDVLLAHHVITMSQVWFRTGIVWLWEVLNQAWTRHCWSIVDSTLETTVSNLALLESDHRWTTTSALLLLTRGERTLMRAGFLETNTRITAHSRLEMVILIQLLAACLLFCESWLFQSCRQCCIRLA